MADRDPRRRARVARQSYASGGGGNVLPSVSVSGPATVVEGENAVFSAFASDPDGSIASYAWAQTAGPAANIVSGQGTTTLTVLAPAVSADTSMSWACTVTDNSGGTATSSRSTTVLDSTPVAGSNFIAGDNVPIGTWLEQLPVFNDIIHNSGGWEGPGIDQANPPILDAQGWPTADCSNRIFNPAGSIPSWLTGTYKLSYKAKSMLTVAGTGGSVLTVANHVQHSGPNVSGDYLFLADVTPDVSGNAYFFINFTGSSDGLRDVKMTRPGVAYEIISDGSGAGSVSVTQTYTDILRRSASLYGFLRFMDWGNANGVYDVTAFSGRNTSSGWTSYGRDGITYPGGAHREVPLEYLCEFANDVDKDAWFTPFISYSDSALSSYAALVASQLQSGLKAYFELGNEPWNTGSAFKGYRYNNQKAAEELEFWGFPATTYNGLTWAPGSISSITSDGATATITFSAAHGKTGSPQIAVLGVSPTTFRTGSGGTAGTVTGATTLTYSTTAPAGSVTTPTSSAGAGVCLNAASNLLWNNLQNWYQAHIRYHARRAFAMATQVKAAFAAAGRGADCRPILAWQVGQAYTIREHILNYLAANYAAPSSVFWGLSVGGYYNGKNQNISGGGYVNQETGASAATTTQGVIDALRICVDNFDQRYMPQVTAALAYFNDMIPCAYEIGIDTVQFTNQTPAAAANADPQQEQLVRDWIWNHQRFGYPLGGWYQCGVQANFSSFNCFALGLSPEQIDPDTVESGQSYKLRGLRQVIEQAPPSGTYHVYSGSPLVIDARDHIGNKFWSASAAYPTLSGQNVPNMPVLNGTHVVYYVWKATAGTVHIHVRALLTTTATSTAECKCNASVAQVTGLALASRGSGNTVEEDIEFDIALQAGANYIAFGGLSVSAQSSRVSLRSVTVSAA